MAGGPRLTFEQKHRICKQKSQHPSISQANLAKWVKTEFNLEETPNQSMISRCLANQKKFEQKDGSELHQKRTSSVKHEQLEEALLYWVLQCQAKNMALTGELIKEKGRRFLALFLLPINSLNFSNGWLAKFQKRHRLSSHCIHGESGSVNLIALNEVLPEIKQKISRYNSRDVYNMDETGLFYCYAPNRTISRDRVEGLKADKTRITIAFTANADGSHKLDPFFIGHAKKPRCFGKKSAAEHGFVYDHNKKAWMTGVLFQEWLMGVDKVMKQANRKILLLLDNAPSHRIDDMTLTHVEVLFLPPNTTSKVQPMDAGIIASFKRHYRLHHYQRAIDRFDAGDIADIYKIDQLTAMQWACMAWKEISASTIKNCFQHTGLFDKDTATEFSVSTASQVLDDAEVNVEYEICCALQRMDITLNAMSLEAILNPVEEVMACHTEMTDEEIVATVSRKEEEAEEEISDVRDDEQVSSTEKVQIISRMISILDLGDTKEQQMFYWLREKQNSIRMKDLHQTTIDDYLS